MRFVDVLLSFDAERARAAARRMMRDLGDEPFLEEVLARAMHELGRRWAQGTVTVSQEHAASQTVATLMTELNASLHSKPAEGPTVVLCVPQGEYHSLPLLWAERPLLKKGYRPLNIGASAPTDSIVKFVRSSRPAGVLISVTWSASLEAGRLLARKLHQELPEMRVAIGGQAVERSGEGPALEGVEVVRGPLHDYLARWTIAPHRG